MREIPEYISKHLCKLLVKRYKVETTMIYTNTLHQMNQTIKNPSDI
jgi:hypothetical protein